MKRGQKSTNYGFCKAHSARKQLLGGRAISQGVKRSFCGQNTEK